METSEMEVDQENQDDIEKEIAKFNVEEAYKGVVPLYETLAPAHLTDFKHHETRCYDKFYCTNFSQFRNFDTCFTMQNRGKITLKNHSVTSLLHLSPRHCIFQERQRIKVINFCQQQVSISPFGSQIRKKFLSPENLLCTIHMEDNTQYPVYVGIRGTLVEVNPDLLQNPNLIFEDPTSKGYLAIFCISEPNHLQNLLTLKTKEEYDSMGTS